MKKSRLPKVQMSSIEEASNKIEKIRKTVLKTYKTGNLKKAEELLHELINKELAELGEQQPDIERWLTSAVILMKLTQQQIGAADILIFILVLCKSFKIQNEVDDIQEMFEGFDEEKKG